MDESGGAFHPADLVVGEHLPVNLVVHGSAVVVRQVEQLLVRNVQRYISEGDLGRSVLDGGHGDLMLHVDHRLTTEVGSGFNTWLEFDESGVISTRVQIESGAVVVVDFQHVEDKRGEVFKSKVFRLGTIGGVDGFGDLDVEDLLLLGLLDNLFP